MTSSAEADDPTAGVVAPQSDRGALTIAGMASIGAGLIHAAAIGIHTEHVTLTRLFVVLAVSQVGAGAIAVARAGRTAALAIMAINLAAVAGWTVTRLVGISWIDGLGEREPAQLADTVAAAFATAAVLTGCLFVAGRSLPRLGTAGVAIPAVLVAALTVPAMVNATDHRHAGRDDHHDALADAVDGALHAGDDHHADGAQVPGDDGAAAFADPASDGDAHVHGDGELDPEDRDPTADEVAVTASAWPRPWDPTGPIDFAGVPGVTAEQQSRAEQLVADAVVALPRFADVAAAVEAGYSSIGDASTGFEHFINRSLILDDTWLDPDEPEALVYRVDGDDRTLVSAMFIAGARPVDDPELVDFGGPLMQWHVHDNLCWGLDESGEPKVMAVTDNHGGKCPPGTVHAGGDIPMVHVWIASHPCGPFAALEGHGAGQVAGDGDGRSDQCTHDQTSDHHDTAADTPRPYDPELPIDLGGVEGVTPQQQAFAENLVAATVRDLPQWSDPAVAEAAGFRSIRDGLTGHEHYIQWEWIDDDVWLDPDFPESLVYEPQRDGSKRLVSAMYMLPPGMQLDEVPDWGGSLMQWHIHDNLCFTDDPEAPRVASVTGVGGSCRAPLVKMQPAPMIHVWIVPHECGPFAALEGVAAGQILDGEERWCDTAHGAH